MRYLIALLFPCLSFFTINRPISGIICLVLQITLIGWLPATIWAMFEVNSFNTEKQLKKTISDLNKGTNIS